jgi:hypothetical protein
MPGEQRPELGASETSLIGWLEVEHKHLTPLLKLCAFVRDTFHSIPHSPSETFRSLQMRDPTGIGKELF